MTPSKQAISTPLEKLDFRVLLDKPMRREKYVEGNRNPFIAAWTYYALIPHRYSTADNLRDIHAAAKSAKEAKYIRRRTEQIVKQRRAEAFHAANYILRNHSDEDWHPTAGRVLGAILLYMYVNGYCSAKQENIGRAAGLSREQTNVWVGRLREAGVIERVSFDWRGCFVWRGRQYDKWCHVYQLAAFPGVQWLAWYRALPNRKNSTLRDSVKPKPERHPIHDFFKLPKPPGFRIPPAKPP